MLIFDTGASTGMDENIRSLQARTKQLIGGHVSPLERAHINAGTQDLFATLAVRNVSSPPSARPPNRTMDRSFSVLLPVVI